MTFRISLALPHSFFLLMLGFGSTLHCSAKELRPTPGVAIDQTRTVTLMERIPSPCVSIPMPNMTLHLSAERLNTAAQRTRTSNTELEREIAIQAERAKSLLEKLGKDVDKHGCRTPRAPMDTDDLYWILEEIEDGRVAASQKRSNKRLSSLHIRYRGIRCGELCGWGSTTVLIPKTKTSEFTVEWWRA